mgnify:CR=1 FL=1
MQSNKELKKFAQSLLDLVPVILKEFLKQQNKKIANISITLPQLFIMGYLDKQGKSKMKDLASFMNVTHATMTGIVDRLVRDHYVERLFDASDRRIINVALTPKGSSLARKIYTARLQMIMHIFSKVSQKDRQSYLNILSQIKNVFQNETRLTSSKQGKVKR